MALKNLFKNSVKKEEPESEAKESAEKKEGDTPAPKLFVERKKPDPLSTSVDDLYPFGFRTYGNEAPESDSIHICNSKLVCPACKQEITVIRPLVANLHLKCIDDDLRRHYKQFEPIWYDIWHCPHCYYSAINSDFEGEKENVYYYADNIKLAMKPYKDAKVISFSEPRKVEEVITSMYMAIRCADFYDCKPVALAKTWLHLSWIYKDLEDEEMYLKVSEKALEAYKRMYYEARQDFPPLVEQTCFIVMGELNILLKNYNDAYECLVHSKLVENGNRLHKMNAQNRIADVREMMKAEKEE